MFGDEFFRDMLRMQREMDRLFSQAFDSRLPALEHSGSGRELASAGDRGLFRLPRCDLRETESSIIAAFELPGVDKKDIELNITDDSIEVKVEKKEEKETEKKDTYSYVRGERSFYRSIPLAQKVDASKAEAEYRDGMLRIEIPKKEQDKKRKIEIK